MSEAPNLSIITTTFRNDDDLALTLGSLVRSGLTGCELVVVDGQPDDASQVGQVVESAGLDASITVTVLHGPDSGPYHAMNRGVLNSSRRWLWFMNSGDQFTEESHALYDAAERGQADWAMGRGWLAAVGNPLPDYPGTLESLRIGETPCHQSILVSREAIARVGLFDLRYRIGADYDMMLPLAKESEPSRCDEPVCLYQGGGMSDVQQHRSQVEYQLARQRRGILTAHELPLEWARVGRRWWRFRKARR